MITENFHDAVLTEWIRRNNGETAVPIPECDCFAGEQDFIQNCQCDAPPDDVKWQCSQCRRPYIEGQL